MSIGPSSRLPLLDVVRCIRDDCHSAIQESDTCHGQVHLIPKVAGEVLGKILVPRTAIAERPEAWRVLTYPTYLPR